MKTEYLLSFVSIFASWRVWDESKSSHYYDTKTRRSKHPGFGCWRFGRGDACEHMPGKDLRSKVWKMLCRVGKLYLNNWSVKKRTHKESCRRRSTVGTRWSDFSADIHYTRNPHKANLSEEIRLDSAGESAVHAAEAEAITRKPEFSDGCSFSPAACLRPSRRANTQKEERKEKKRLAVCLKCQNQGWWMRLPNYLKAEMKDCWKNRQDLMQLAWREHTLFPLFLP